MFFCPQRKQAKSTQKQPGNSLTFLLGTLAVLGVSLTTVTIALAPMSTNQVNNLVYTAAVKEVADHHLDQLEAYITANPQIFLEPGNWDTLETHDNDSLPPYQRFNNTKFTDVAVIPNVQKDYSENVKINNMSVTIKSRLFWDSTATAPRYSILRLSATPYENTMVIAAEAKAGSVNVSRKRFVSASPNQCGLPTDHKDYANAYREIATEADENGDFKIRQVYEPYMQVGSQRICKIPKPGDLDGTNSLSCDYNELGNELLYAKTDNFTNGSDIIQTDMVFSLKRQRNWDETLNLGLGGWHYWKEFKLTYTQKNLTTGAITTSTETQNFDDSTSADRFKIAVFRPSRADANHTYKAMIFYQGSNDMSVSWARWKDSGIFDSEGIFNNGDFATIGNADNNLDLESYAYDETSNTLAMAGESTATSKPQIQVRKVDPKITDPEATPTLNAAVLSTTPAPGNEANPVDSGNYNYGTPVISKHADFVVTVLNEQGGGNDDFIMAMSTKNIKIGSANNSMSNAVTSNFANLMKIDNTDADEITLWYSQATNKYYWLTFNNDGVRKYLYEWDPKTWGIGTTDSDKWMANGASVAQAKSNISYVGEDANNSNNYTGNYDNVRKIGPQPGEGSTPIWETNTADKKPLQIAFNQSRNEFYIRADERMTIVNLTKGYTRDVRYSNGVGGSFENEGSDVSARTTAFDPRTGWYYYTSENTNASSGLWAYDPSGGITYRVVSDKDFDVENTDNTGDGNLVYSMENETLYFLDLAGGGTRPKLYGYIPYCYSIGKTDKLAGDLPGFTKKGLPLYTGQQDTWYAY